TRAPPDGARAPRRCAHAHSRTPRTCARASRRASPGSSRRPEREPPGRCWPWLRSDAAQRERLLASAGSAWFRSRGEVADHVLQNLDELDVESRFLLLDIGPYVGDDVFNIPLALRFQLHQNVARIGFRD